MIKTSGLRYLYSFWKLLIILIIQNELCNFLCRLIQCNKLRFLSKKTVLRRLCKKDTNFKNLLPVGAHYAGELPKFWHEHLLYEDGKYCDRIRCDESELCPGILEHSEALVTNWFGGTGDWLAEVVGAALNCPQLIIFTTPVKTAESGGNVCCTGETSTRTGAPTPVVLANLPLLTAVRDHILLPKIRWTYWMGTNPGEFIKILIGRLRNHRV